LESNISSPVLWSPENPKLYKLVTTVEVDGQVVDQVETPFGIRTVGFDKDKGFLLNGKHYELYGTCNHQDMAGVGAALPDALQEFRVKKLKEFGCNAIRTSHNPPTPELLDACDRLGMLVMDENRLLGSDRENLKKWDDQIRRDRNHPSVAIWSIANEEFTVQDTPQAANVSRTMQELAHDLDPTRPVTDAANEGNVFAGINSIIEVRGWNYNGGPDIDKYHAEHPDQPEVGTEQASTVCTRGIYANDPQHGYVRAYDLQGTQTAERWWSYFDARPWLSGGFVWTGFDYRGEPTPYGWPCINSHFGILDTCGFPKDNFYYYQAWWTTNVVLHLLPHWDWPGKEGQDIDVWAYSNCKEVELFLNGKSLGRQTMPHDGHLAWQVKYAPGTLSARGFGADGKVIAETKVETTGEPAAVQLAPDRSNINADGEDVRVIKVSAVDADGRFVPIAQNLVHFELTGVGRILGVGNGDPSCHEADTLVLESPETVTPLNDWRWKLTDGVQRSNLAEYAAAFDDSAWNKDTLEENDCSQLEPNQSAVFRQHIKLSAADLAGPKILIQIGRIDDIGWVYVNGQLAGEAHDWSAMQTFDFKKFLHEGDNVVAVGVQNLASGGGIGCGVYLRVAGHPIAPAWSRSLFNGLAEVIVQSGTNAGGIKLTASADGLKSTTATIQAVARTTRSSAENVLSH
jgi:beta-galactosidase